MLERMGNSQGHFVQAIAGGEAVRAFVPNPLPPSPPLDLSGRLTFYDAASAAVGRLDGVTAVLPSPPLFIFMYVRKEALLSSQIEGTQSSLSDLLLFENDEIPQVPIEDVAEVSNYVAAMEHGLKRLQEGFRFGSSVRCMEFCFNQVEGPASNRASSDDHKTGLEEHARATPYSYLLRLIGCVTVSTRSRSSSTLRILGSRRSSRLASLMFSSKRSIPFSMAMVALADFWSR